LRDDEPSEIPEATADSNPETLRTRKGGAVIPRLLGLMLKPPTPGKGVLALIGGGRINLSAAEEGDLGKDVRKGKLPGGEVEIESRCWFLLKVGVKSGPSSNDKNRDDSKDSKSSNRNWGQVKYVTESEMVPMGWGIDGNSCDSLGRDVEEAESGVSVSAG
jgi:hypothetical protein